MERRQLQYDKPLAYGLSCMREYHVVLLNTNISECSLLQHGFCLSDEAWVLFKGEPKEYDKNLTDFK